MSARGWIHRSTNPTPSSPLLAGTPSSTLPLEPRESRSSLLATESEMERCCRTERSGWASSTSRRERMSGRPG
ncbi:hypothetical protein BDY24DRAFT_374782 [Mrakia frigida]|uniref:uncharacterized protein n=1 Tax=Mrakia frigida TaxID=29902 RepID=UPI003FCC0E3F